MKSLITALVFLSATAFAESAKIECKAELAAQKQTVPTDALKAGETRKAVSLTSGSDTFLFNAQLPPGGDKILLVISTKGTDPNRPQASYWGPLPTAKASATLKFGAASVSCTPNK